MLQLFSSQKSQSSTSIVSVLNVVLAKLSVQSHVNGNSTSSRNLSIGSYCINGNVANDDLVGSTGINTHILRH
jgi:hypothetical protein